MHYLYDFLKDRENEKEATKIFVNKLLNGQKSLLEETSDHPSKGQLIAFALEKGEITLSELLGKLGSKQFQNILNEVNPEYFKEEKKTCSICGETIYSIEDSNNPIPYKSKGRCCSVCSFIYVLPYRIFCKEKFGDSYGFVYYKENPEDWKTLEKDELEASD